MIGREINYRFGKIQKKMELAELERVQDLVAYWQKLANEGRNWDEIRRTGN